MKLSGSCGYAEAPVRTHQKAAFPEGVGEAQDAAAQVHLHQVHQRLRRSVHTRALPYGA
jgi:hypothetical protein